MGWLYLLLAGVFEVGFTTALRYVGWPPKPWPVAAFLAASAVSFVFLAAATRSIPLGTAYAVWTGIGAAGTAIVGILWYGEPTTTLRLVFLVTLVGSIMGLKLVSP